MAPKALSTHVPKEENNERLLLRITWLPTSTHLGCFVPTGAYDWKTKVNESNLFPDHFFSPSRIKAASAIKSLQTLKKDNFPSHGPVMGR